MQRMMSAGLSCAQRKKKPAFIVKPTDELDPEIGRWLISTLFGLRKSPIFAAITDRSVFYKSTGTYCCCR